MRILHVEDEPDLSRKVANALRGAGYDVLVAMDGHVGLRMATEESVELVVLDVNLPGRDGFSILEELRKNGRTTPRVLMLTARAELGERVQGLRGGADDYLAKPFAMEELLARVEALGRRAEAPKEDHLFRLGKLWVDALSRKVRLGEEVVALSPREFEVLLVLLSSPGRIFSRDEICEKIWQREHEYDTRTVEIFIMRLRKKLGDEKEGIVIDTVRSVGYRIRKEEVPTAGGQD